MTSWIAGSTVADAMRRPYDNFALIRLALALAVVVSHASSVVTGQLDDEPLKTLTGFTLGEHAVNGFFAISGFLVTMSFARRGWRDYVAARALRIAPGFVAAVLVVAFLLGPALTSLGVGAYFADGRLWRFLAATLTSFKSAIVLPGVFDANPLQFPMGTVWTLKYEVLCYAGVLGLGVIGLLTRKLVAVLLPAGLFAALGTLQTLEPELPKGVETALRLPLLFAAGGALYVLRDQVRLSALAVAALSLAAWSAFGTPLYGPVVYMAQAYGVIWLALAPGLSHPRLEPAYDLSYGTYLYGWPVQQALQALLPAAGAAALLAPSIVLTLAVAALSWVLVERPALRLKRRWIRPRPDLASGGS